MLSNQQFDRMRQLALSLAGIELSERHRELLERRSMRLGIHDGAGLDLLLKSAQTGEVGIGGVYSPRREAGTAWGMMSVSSTGRMNP